MLFLHHRYLFISSSFLPSFLVKWFFRGTRFISRIPSSAPGRCNNAPARLCKFVRNVGRVDGKSRLCAALLHNSCYLFRTVSVATITAEKPTATACSNKWQPPVIKGRFSKSVWLGEPTPPPPPNIEYLKAKK